MGQLGIGAMIRALGGAGKDSAITFSGGVGKVITALSLNDDVLRFEFADGTKFRIVDNGQSCCEVRYMRTDDDLAAFVGATLLGAEIKEAPSIEDKYGEHEVQFLEVKTNKGSFVMASHNEHNGYYGGFAIEVVPARGEA